LIGGQNSHEFIELAGQEAPGHLDMLDEAMAGVLREYGNSPDARIDGVREREIDDAKLAAEVDCRFGAVGREIEESTAPTAGEHDRRGAARQLEAGHHIVADHLKALRPIFLVELIHVGANLGGHNPADSSTGPAAELRAHQDRL